MLADFDGLRLAPMAPAAWKEYRVRKQFRGRNFDFTFHHQSGNSQITSVTLNGAPMEPTDGEYKLPLAGLKPGETVTVEVTL